MLGGSPTAGPGGSPRSRVSTPAAGATWTTRGTVPGRPSRSVGRVGTRVPGPRTTASPREPRSTTGPSWGGSSRRSGSSVTAAGSGERVGTSAPQPGCAMASYDQIDQGRQFGSGATPWTPAGCAAPPSAARPATRITTACPTCSSGWWEPMPREWTRMETVSPTATRRAPEPIRCRRTPTGTVSRTDWRSVSGVTR